MIGITTPNTELTGLHPVIPPDPIPFEPVTLGWFILTGLVVILMIILIIWRYMAWMKRKYRRQARRVLLTDIKPRLLSAHERSTGLMNLSVLLKSVAMQSHSRELVAGLSGKAWTNYLSRTCSRTDFNTEPGNLLADSQYQPTERLSDMERDQIMQLVRMVNKWIGGHRV
jgi:hypothetical protein